MKIYDFVLSAKKKHGEKYNYEKSVYNGAQQKTEIICHTHGSFFQTPKAHIKGQGCPKCGGTHKLDQEEFVERSKKTHSNKYDYSLSVYKTISSKVEIICPEHGSFFQVPKSHMEGNGCPKCGGTKQLTQEEFIERSKKIHSNKYDYSLSTYKTIELKVEIICPEHGSFKQSPHMHLFGSGCPNCAKNKKRTQEEFTKQAKNIHNDKYGYEKVDYINDRTKVMIVCKKHGEFKCQPNRHVFGKTGCPKCKSSKGEDAIRNFLLRNNVNFEEQKMFKTCKNKRLLPFDFYLTDLNILIEFQGKQHFVYIANWNSLQQTQSNDRIKKEWCIENNIKLLEINYQELNKIEEILEKII